MFLVNKVGIGQKFGGLRGRLAMDGRHVSEVISVKIWAINLFWGLALEMHFAVVEKVTAKTHIARFRGKKTYFCLKEAESHFSSRYYFVELFAVFTANFHACSLEDFLHFLAKTSFILKGRSQGRTFSAFSVRR